MDVLSDVLDTVRVERGMLFQTELCAPWGIRAASRENLAFHVITRGHCWLTVDGLDEPLAVESGDVVVLGPGRAHTLRDAPDTPARDIEDLLADGAFCRIGEVPAEPEPAGTSRTQVVCGWFTFADPRSDLLLAELPPVLHAKQQATDAGSWLFQTVKMLSYESLNHQPGMSTVINRLCDALFVYVLRVHLAELPPGRPSWLRALVDPQVGSALALVHTSPAAPWTVDKLASDAGMSRSAFSARFTKIVGESPMQYLAQWRLRKAAAILRDSDLDLTAVATRTGYASAAAFSKAFAREYGIAPGAYRQTTRTRPGTPVRSA